MRKVTVGFDYELEEYYCRECLTGLYADESHCPCCGNELDWGDF